MNSFYTIEELQSIGLKSFGTNVYISKKASIYGAENISIGDNVRIDDFCILSGNISIGSNIHISAYVGLYGANGIKLGDYCGISPMTLIFSAMDDFSGHFLIGPVNPSELINVTGGEVVLEKFSQIGAGCIIFPNVIISEGSVIGAMSLVKSTVTPWSMNAGIPARKIKDRSRELIDKLNLYLSDKSESKEI